MELTISGGRQSGKSTEAMRMAIEAARAGQRVIFDADSHHMARARFDDLQRMVSADDVAKVVRANGDERIDFRGGGQILMSIRARGGGRGIYADVHVIDHEREGGEVNPTVSRVIRTRLDPVCAECQLRGVQVNTGSGDLDRLYVAVRSNLSPGMQLAQAVHAAFHFSHDWPTQMRAWIEESNFLVVVAVPDEAALADLAARAVEEGIARTIVREPDLDNTITAVALQPGADARRLCAQLPLALKEHAMT